MNRTEAIKVLIVNEDGHYLAGTTTHWEFTEDRSRARVFDYDSDRVPEQLDVVKRAHGNIWIAVRLDPREAYEFCDRCGMRILAVQAFFDSSQFLCPDCRTEVIETAPA